MKTQNNAWLGVIQKDKWGNFSPEVQAAATYLASVAVLEISDQLWLMGNKCVAGDKNLKCLFF